MLALAFFIVGSPAANAFGSEVLGCSVDSAAWTAYSCGGGGTGLSLIHYSPQNLSGTYSKSWTLIDQTGSTYTRICSGSTDSTTIAPCIYRGCTSSSTICEVKARSGPTNDRVYTARLRLTQSGLTRTIEADAVLYASDSCLKCV